MFQRKNVREKSKVPLSINLFLLENSIVIIVFSHMRPMTLQYEREIKILSGLKFESFSLNPFSSPTHQLKLPYNFSFSEQKVSSL